MMTASPNTEGEGDQGIHVKEIWRKNSRIQVQLEEDGSDSTRQS